jgi:hypothetical protein
MLKQLNQAEFRNYSGQDDYIRIDEFLVAYVGSDQQLYQAIGFKKVYNSECWLKYFGEEKS